MFSRNVILRALVCALLAMFPLPEQENQIYDFKVRTLSKTHYNGPDSVVLLETTKEDFDILRKKFQTSIPSLGQEGEWKEKYSSLRDQFFWNEDVYGEILEKILTEAPKKLLINFFYTESLVTIKNNPRLQKLARKPSVLWASQFDLDQKLLKPAPELTGIENYGFNNLIPDADGVVRRASLLHKNHISLPFRALIEGKDSLKAKVPLTTPFLINYKGPPGFIRSCNVRDLFGPEKNSCGSLKDKFVILSPKGSLVTGASLHRTPVGYMSRGEILARILTTAQTGNPIQVLSPYLLFLALFAQNLLLSYFVLRCRGGKQLLVVTTLLISEILFSLGLMRFFALQVPLVPFVLSTASAYLAFLWLKSSQQEVETWQAEKKNQYLKELDELKSNFLSLMSHDLKTPIAKIQALSERLARDAKNLSENQKDILKSIQRSNEELSEYILSLLNFQRIETQELKLLKKNNDINLLIEDVAERLFPLYHERGITLELILEPMFPLEIDEQLMKQVLTNLIDNAIKYNNPGTKIFVESKDLGNFVEITVKDNGVGLGEEQKRTLFQKFSRSEKSGQERVKGTGLGLYLARYFIELHGGKIEVESQLGEGTTFRFQLPLP